MKIFRLNGIWMISTQGAWNVLRVFYGDKIRSIGSLMDYCDYDRLETKEAKKTEP